MKKIISSIILLILILQITTITLAVENIQQEEKEEVNEEKNIELTQTEEIKATAEEDSWTDFSKANITVTKDGVSGVCVEISGIAPLEKSSYFIYLSNSSNNINIEDINKEEYIYLSKNTEKNSITSKDGKIAKSMELNQDIYGTIIERLPSGKEKIVLSSTKLSRFAEAQNYDAFFATHMTHNSTQIITTFTHDEENSRKLQIKIGKITDYQILKKIQEKNASGFSDLMTYAKSQTNSLYNNTSVVESDSYAIEYDTDDANKVIKLNGLEDKEYYYLYVKADDENGKYVFNEAVTLAQSSVYENGSWYMFFYGTNDFKWKDLGTILTEDPTVSNGKYPNTGKIVLGTGIVVLIGATYILHRKNKKYKDIK